MVFRLK